MWSILRRPACAHRTCARGPVLLLASLILGALGAGCTSDPIALHQAPPPRVVVLPPVDTITRIGDIINLTATVDGPGEPGLPGPIVWTSLNESVATVDSLGKVRGAAAGVALIVATVGGEADTATIVVAPAHSSVQFGVHMDVTWSPSRAYSQSRTQEAVEVHATVSRNSLLWHLVEPVRGVQDWSIPDGMVDDLLAQSIQPLMLVQGSPTWANGVAATDDAYYFLHVPTDSIAFVGWVAAYKEFIRSAARRYRGKVRLWELGNEQNYEGFWRPKVNVAQYAYWYAELRDAIKAEIPDAIVAVGGLTLLTTPDNRIGPNVNGVNFVQQLYALNVLPDAVAVHPYTTGGAGPDVHIDGVDNFDDIDAVRAVMVQWGQGARPIWVTEWGWNVTAVTPSVQAAYLHRSLELLDTRYSSYVTIATYFALNDHQPNLFYGLFDSSGTRRPAGDVFEAFMRR